MFIDDTSVVNGTRVRDGTTGEVVELSAAIVLDSAVAVVGNCTRVRNYTIGVDGTRVSNCTARVVGNCTAISEISRVVECTRVGDGAKILEVA